MCDKPFLTYEQQLLKLKSYNLEIDDNNIELELELLKNISYYDLVNTYKDCFMVDNKFIDKTTLFDVFLFNNIDKKFQNILLHYSIYVENVFKTKMAYFIGKNKGVRYTDYLDETKYHCSNPKRRNKLNKVIGNFINTHFNSNDTPTSFYRKNHNHIPPWILFKNVTFNNIIDLYSFLKRDEKLEIISEYKLFNNSKLSEDEKLELFKNMLTITRKFRNKIAHNYKVIGVNLDNVEINLTVAKKIDIFNIINHYDIRDNRGKNDLFSMIISILFLLNIDLIYLLFLRDLEQFKTNIFTIDSSPEIKLLEVYILKSNLPKNFFELINRTQEKFYTKKVKKI